MTPRKHYPLLTLMLLLATSALLHGQSGQGPNDRVDPKEILLQDLNQTRLERARPPLALDAELSLAAQRHADLMASRGQLEHDLPGEAGLAERCSADGAHFSSIAENIAQGWELHAIHQSWLHSPPHLENLLDPAYNRVGIGVARRGHDYYAVEDFASAVAAETPDSVEQRVRDMLAVRGIQPTVAASVARAVCADPDPDSNGPAMPGLGTPGMVMRFASPDLEKLGPVLDQRIPPGSYKRASVGACATMDSRGFTRYKLALLLY